MDTIIKNMLNKDREAFDELYASIKNRICFLSFALTKGDSESSSQIAKKAITQSFQEILEGRIITQADFEAFAVNKTIELCRETVLEKDPSAFDVLPENDEKLTSIDEDAIDTDLSGAKNYIRALPAAAAWELVLRLIQNMNNKKIARIMDVDESYIKTIQKSEYESLETVYRLVTRKGVHCPAPTKELIQAAFENEIENFKVPEEVESRVNEYIAERSDPPKKKINIKKLCLIAIPAVIIIVIALALLIKPKANQQIASESSADMLNIEAIKSAGVTYVTENPESLDPNLIYFADIDIKDHGVITIMLYHDYAPITTANFIKLSTEDFYDGLTFHRIMSGFMMQGGDPLGNGQGGSSQNIVGEFVQNGHPNYLSHARGAVSMARATDYNSASSQFFIVHEDSSFLDGQYAAFGYVVSGMDIVDTICTSARPTDGNGTIPKDEQPVMNDVSIWSVEYATLVGE